MSSASFGSTAEVDVVHDNIVWHGDSLTYGENGKAAGSTDATRLAVVLKALGPNMRGTNFGNSGHTLAQMISEAESRLETLYDPMSRDNYLIVQGGHNSLCSLGGYLSPEECISQIQFYLATALARRSWKLIWCTQLPAAYPVGYPKNFDELRGSINSFMRASWQSLGISALSDVAVDRVIGGDGCEYNSEYYSSFDCTHLTDAGYLIWGNYDLRALASIMEGRRAEAAQP